MFKTIMTIIATVIGVLLSMQNFDPVPVYFFSGKAVNIRLIFVIAIAGVMGYLIRHFYSIAKEEKLKRQIQHLLRMQHQKKRTRTKKNGDFKKEIWVNEVDEDEI